MTLRGRESTKRPQSVEDNVETDLINSKARLCAPGDSGTVVFPPLQSSKDCTENMSEPGTVCGAVPLAEPQKMKFKLLGGHQQRE